jgi:hypothetical protein
LRSKEYFQVLIFFFLVLLILFVCSSVPQFLFIPELSNCFLSYCEEELDPLKEYFDNLANKDELKFQIQDVLLCFSVLLIFLFKNLFFWFLVKQNKEYNKKVNSVKHFSVHAHNLKAHTEFEIKGEIIKYFYQNNHNFKFLKQNDKVELAPKNIKEISLIKDVSNIHKLILQFIKEIKKFKIKEKKGKMTETKAKKIKLKMQGIRDKIIEIRTAKYLNEALITFDNNHIPQYLITNKWKLIFKKYITKDLFFGTVMNPEDIIWENFSASDFQRLFKYIFSYLISFVILLGTVLV